ncbi:hypothetical protein RI367_006687 [Sorochytrium milnesiophthora]
MDTFLDGDGAQVNTQYPLPSVDALVAFTTAGVLIAASSCSVSLVIDEHLRGTHYTPRAVLVCKIGMGLAYLLLYMNHIAYFMPTDDNARCVLLFQLGTAVTWAAYILAFAALSLRLNVIIDRLFIVHGYILKTLQWLALVGYFVVARIWDIGFEIYLCAVAFYPVWQRRSQSAFDSTKAFFTALSYSYLPRSALLVCCGIVDLYSVLSKHHITGIIAFRGFYSLVVLLSVSFDSALLRSAQVLHQRQHPQGADDDSGLPCTQHRHPPQLARHDSIYIAEPDMEVAQSIRTSASQLFRLEDCLESNELSEPVQSYISSIAETSDHIGFSPQNRTVIALQEHEEQCE